MFLKVVIIRWSPDGNHDHGIWLKKKPVRLQTLLSFNDFKITIKNHVFVLCSF